MIRYSPPFTLAMVVACISLGACHLVAGLDDREPTSAASSVGASEGNSGVSAGGNGSGGIGAGGTSTALSSSGNGGVGGTGGTRIQMCPAGYECVPEGTTGDFVRLPGSNETCRGAWSVAVPYAPPNDPGCNVCTCGSPQGGSCSLSLTSYSNSTCAIQLESTAATVNTCFDLSGTASAFIVDPVAQLGSCAPAGGGPIQLSTIMACGTYETPDMSCGAGMVCVPEGSGELCNVVSEGQSCAVDYQDMLVTLATVENDTRQCTCECANPNNPQCINSSAVMYNTNNCSSPVALIPLTGQCEDTANTSGSVALDPGTWSADPCTSFTIPGGSVTFGPSQKLCCLEGG